MKLLFKLIKYTGLCVLGIVILLFVAPYFFPETIGNNIKKLANQNIKGELNFKKSRLSFFHHFPSLTLTLYDVQLNGSAPFAKDTLVAAKELSFGINLKSLVQGNIKVDEIFLYGSSINILVDSAGNPNYNVYQSSSTKTNANTADTSASLKIERIVIEKSSLVYDDDSLPMYINAQQFEYEGKGDLSKAIFDLASNIKIGKIDFEYGKQKYFIAKTLQANLITKINTNSLAFDFEKNDILINKLPLNFKGHFEFLKDGYDMDFRIHSLATELEKLVTAFPPEFLKWSEETVIKGTADITASLSGKYISSTNTMPSFTMNMGIRSGYIAHKKTPAPISNLFLNFNAALPQLNTDSLLVNIDSIFFNINKDYVSSVIALKGLNKPAIHAKLKTDIDLQQWDEAIGFAPIDVKGRLKINAVANGMYSTAVVEKNFREKDTIISSIPTFTIDASLQNGYFKYAALPQALTNIAANLKASNSDGKYEHSSITLSNININLLKNFIKGNIAFDGKNNNAINSNVKIAFNLNDIQQFYPLDSLQLKGNVQANIISKGNYNMAAKQFPVTNANIALNKGFIQTKYYPNPITNIQVKAIVTNTNGNISGTNMLIEPAGFMFENKPFAVTASLKNFANIAYNIKANGTIDIGKIYSVFAVPTINAEGLLETNLQLKGIQADAVKGRYNKLYNNGYIKVKNIAVNYTAFPLPFVINNGLFTFKNADMQFSNFSANYGKSNFTLQGSLSNVINYVLEKNATLKGNFNFGSSGVYVDELMAFNAGQAASASPNSGVIIIPKNIDIVLNANAKKVLYKGLQLSNATGAVHINKGSIEANNVGFEVINAAATMSGSYNTISPYKAAFKYAIKSENFDIAKAYKEIELFKELASAAKYCKGVVGIDYNVAGKLNANMMPIYPSIVGGGVITVHDVKINGMKLWTAVSKATNRDSVNNPNIKKVAIKTSIKNNIITVERTRMRIMGFRPRIEGQVNFYGAYNLQMRLGLPPLGIFGIPMTITGSGSNPKVKLGRGKKEDELEEKTEEENEQE